MVDVSCEIKDAKLTVAGLSYCYAKNATFGKATDEELFKMVRIFNIIAQLERYQDYHCEYNILVLQEGDIVLPLESTTAENSPCLSDSEVCTLVEQLNFICSRV